MNMFLEVADIKTADQLDLPTPKIIYETVAVKPTALQQEMVKSLSERAAKVQAGNVDPSRDNMLLITSDGRKLGLDQRVINPLLPDDEGSKVNACINNIHRIWQESKSDRLTQLVFSDLSTPSSQDFNIYSDIKSKLVKRGVPPHEVAFIHDAGTETKKKELFAKVRSGDVRVLIGSTAKCGAGMNIQDKLIALHDLDAPWRPGDLRQRSGRIERQGNQNPEAYIYRYVTESTFDSYLYQILETKQRFISQIMTSKSPVRACDDLDEAALSYAEIKALCAGNPKIKQKMDLDIEVAKLRLLRSNHMSTRYRLEDELLTYFPENIRRQEGIIQGFEQDIATLNSQMPPQDGLLPMEINGEITTDKDTAGTAILSACTLLTEADAIHIGGYRGFEMHLAFNTFTQEHTLTLRGAMSHSVTLGSDSRGNLIRIENALNSMPTRLDTAKSQLANLQNQQQAAKEEVQKPFPQEDELNEKAALLSQLDAELNMGDSEQQTEENEQEQDKTHDDRPPANRPSVLAQLRKTGTDDYTLPTKPQRELEAR